MRSGGTNSLWKYFSLSSTAHPAEPEKNTDGKLNYLIMLIEGLKKQSNVNVPKVMLKEKFIKAWPLSEGLKGDLVNKIRTLASDYKIEVYIRFDDGSMSMIVGSAQQLNSGFINDVTNLGIHYGVNIFFDNTISIK